MKRNVLGLVLAGLLAAPAAAEPPADAPDVRALLDQKVSWVSKDLPLAGVLRGIADAHDLNVVGLEGLDQAITVSLSDVRLGAALDAVLTTRGIGWEVVDDILVVHGGPGLISRAYTVNFADLQETLEVIRGLLSGDGDVALQLRSNRLVVTDAARVHGRVADLLAALDQPPPQVRIEAQLVNIADNTARELGIEWSDQETVIPLPGGDTTLGAGSAFSSEDDDGTSELGELIGGVAPALAGINPVYALALRFFANGDLYQIRARISALVQEGLAEIISAPSLSVLNRETASILVGQEVPFNTRTTLTAGGNETSETEFKRVGIKLEVTPTITDTGQVVLRVVPEVSSIDPLLLNDPGDLIQETSDLPITTTVAETTILLDDGETSLIGGLIQSRASRTESGVPWLRRIPLLGLLFRADSQNLERSELLVLITPFVLKPGSGSMPAGRLGSGYLERQGDSRFLIPPPFLGETVSPEAKATPGPDAADGAETPDAEAAASPGAED